MTLIFIVAAISLVADQASKLFINGFFVDKSNMLFSGILTAEGESIELIPNVLSLTCVYNEGAAFGILKGQRVFFFIITVALLAAGTVLLLRVQKKHLLLKLSAGLVFGGALGNFVDRVIIGVVRDFINLELIDTVIGYEFPVFNGADICVVIGVFLFAVYYIFIHEKYTKSDKNEACSGK